MLNKHKNYKIVRVANATELLAAQDIRKTVFVAEQKIPLDLELDAYDNSSIHLLALKDQDAVATGRLRDVSASLGNISRIAVLPEHRGSGLGKAIVQQLEEIARERHLKELELFPHVYLEKFYQGLGYRKTEDAGTVGAHTLIRMVKILDQKNL